jgi:hypothetical protein
MMVLCGTSYCGDNDDLKVNFDYNYADVMTLPY